jgi:hypothetical protein
MFCYDYYLMEKINQPLRVNEQIVRGIAIEVFTLSVIIILLGFSVLSEFTQIACYLSAAITAFLFIDFLTRAFASSDFSLLAMASKVLSKSIFRFPFRMILLKPRKFAAGIGAAISASALVMHYFDSIHLVQILMGIPAVFSFLEWAFGFCAGCRIFALLVKAGIFREDLCDDCILPGGEGI